MKLLQRYLAKIELATSTVKTSDEERELIDVLKQLPLFENCALECTETTSRFVALKDCSFIYDASPVVIRLPFELPGMKPIVHVDENECKLLVLEKLHLNIVRDFSVIIKEIVRLCVINKDNVLSPHKVIYL